MAQEAEKLNYIYEWFTSDGIHGRIDNAYIPDQASAFARINSFDFKAAKRQEIKAVAREKIEAALPPDQQLGVVAEALRVIRLQQEGGTPTAAQLAKIKSFLDAEDISLTPIRERAKQLIQQVNAQTDWQVIAEFDVEANW